MAISLSRIRRIEKRYQAKQPVSFDIFDCEGPESMDCEACLARYKKAIKQGKPWIVFGDCDDYGNRIYDPDCVVDQMRMEKKSINKLN